MSTLEKKLLALANGKELPWNKTASLLEKLGVKVIPPTGGGSHFKIIYPGHDTIVDLYTTVLSKRFMREK